MLNINLEPIIYHFDDEQYTDAVNQLTQWMNSQSIGQFYRMNPLKIAEMLNLDSERLFEIFLAGNVEGYFKLNWESLCPQCNGLVDSYPQISQIKSVSFCSVCSHEFSNYFDETVQITFSTSDNFLPVPDEIINSLNEEEVSLRMKKGLESGKQSISGLSCFLNPYYQETSLDESNENNLYIPIKSLNLFNIRLDLNNPVLSQENINQIKGILSDIRMQLELNRGVINLVSFNEIQAVFLQAFDAIRAAIEIREIIKKLNKNLTVKYAIINEAGALTDFAQRPGFIHSSWNSYFNQINRIQLSGVFFNEAVLIQPKVKECIKPIAPVINKLSFDNSHFLYHFE